MMSDDSSSLAGDGRVEPAGGSGGVKAEKESDSSSMLIAEDKAQAAEKAGLGGVSRGRLRTRHHYSSPGWSL